MPITTPDVYNEMLDRARSARSAYPAINCTSSETLNATIRGFAEAGSDGIVQVSTGAAFLSGQRLKDMVTGAVALAGVRPRGRGQAPGQHRPAHRPLSQGQARRLHAPAHHAVPGAGRGGQEPLFQSHMWDSSAVPLDERNLRIADELLTECAKARLVMEMEIGVVGGEEDDVVGEMSDKLYSTPRTP